MREIKFRGINIDTGKWVYGGYWTDGEIVQIIHKAPNNNQVHTNVIPESAGQFTGLQDKNGVEIYEGDIVQNGSPNIKIWQGSKGGGAIMKICPIGKVIYSAPAFDIETVRNGMYETANEKQYTLYGDWQDGWANGSIEQDLTVIGNIYENPELFN